MKDFEEQEDSLLNKDNDNQNKNKIPKQKSLIEKIYNDNQNIAFGLSFLGRIIMTFYSFHGLFFCYNLILEYFLLIPGFLFGIQNWFGKFCLSLVYILYSLCLSSILVIPTFEFLTFPYLKYPNSLSHLISFIYIYREKPFDHKEIIHENQKTTFVLNIIFYVIEVLYVIGYLLSFLTKFIILKDLIKCVLLILAYLNYFAVFMNYVIVSFYLIIKILSSKPKERIIINTTENGVLKKVEPAQNIGLNNYNKIEFEKEIGDDNYKLTIEKKKGKEIQDEYKVMIEKYIKKDITDFSWKGFNLAILLKINNYFKDKPKLPDINLVSYIIEPYLFRNYVDKDDKELDKFEDYYCEDVCFNLGIIFKFILFIVIFIITLVYGFFTINWESLIYLILLSFCILVISLAFNFPFCYRNRKTFGAYIWNPKYKLYAEKKRFDRTDKKRKLKYRPRNPNLLAISRFICDSLMLLVSIALVGIFYKLKDDDNKEDFNDVNPNGEVENIKKLLLPNICLSSVHNMPIHLLLPFINDAYYYREIFDEVGPHAYSSLQRKNYRRLFYDEDYDIHVLGNLINETDSVKMIAYNVINKDKDIELTILSIKGTTFNKDIYLDAQLFISSVLMTLLNTFSLISQKSLLSFKIMEYSLSIPYRIFFKYLIVDEYLNKLKNAYNNNEYKFYDNVVIVGHSLGGGLAKLFGRMIKKQGISLSGPGINAFNSLWNYEGESENFEISAIDLVPDRDLVPRVEVSGGTIYRIICKFGAFECHSKVNSLCEVLIMCNSPNYKEYCIKVAGLNKNEINEIADSVKLNN
jgi:hypothetical protein